MSTVSYWPPTKAILSKEQLETFQSSATHKDIIAYIETLNAAVVGIKLGDECPISAVGVRRLESLLNV